MVKTKFIIPVLLALLSCLACKTSGDEEKILNVYMRKPVNGLDIINISQFYEARVAIQIYEGLYEYDYLKEPYEVTPLIAKETPSISSDGLTYIIKIKKGIRFSDDPCFTETDGKGRLLDADDFIFSIKYHSSLKGYTYYHYSLKPHDFIEGLKEFREKSLSSAPDYSMPVKGLVKLDRHTVKIILKEPCPFFTEILSSPNTYIIPKEAVMFYGEKLKFHPVGTGPFMLSSWGDRGGKGKQVTLVKNPYYATSTYPDDESPYTGKKMPFVDKVVLHFIESSEGRLRAFEKAEVDIYSPDDDFFYDSFPEKGTLSRELQKAGTNVILRPQSQFRGLFFNMRNSLFKSNPDLRKAISHAFDTIKHINIVYYGKVLPANWILPPIIFGYDKSFVNKNIRYDRKEAAELLEKSGFPGGEGLPVIELLLSDNTVIDRSVIDNTKIKSLSTFFTESMDEAGIKIKTVFYNNYQDVIKKISGDYGSPQIFFRARYSFYSTPEDILRIFYSNSDLNHSGYSNKEYDDLFDTVKKMPNNGEKMALLNKMRKIITDDSLFIPVGFPFMYRLHHAYVLNYKPHQMAFDRYKYIDIDAKIKRKVLETIRE
ncbi:MAG: hypothetical protein JXA66_02355 [Oligoflexia bacterium]|nr:hypothetical protein [Oligoflexia bacterium]